MGVANGQLCLLKCINFKSKITEIRRNHIYGYTLEN